ncbi:hypothetical protein AB1Y20_003500 [Prymnesium parvum]|uniref:Thioredoxin domain-containing protein n=1 Tax=Prymnesium parvum TaxID=97485 RepID=A0AB34JEM9_PRYPA
MRRWLAAGWLYLAIGAQAESTILTDADFDDLVIRSERPSLLLFYNPLNASQLELQRVWEALGAQFANHTELLVGEVNVTSEGGRALCRRFRVKSPPKVRYFHPPDETVRRYKGALQPEAIGNFAKKLMRRKCSLSRLRKCTRRQQTAMREYMDLSVEELEAEAAAMEEELAASEAARLALEEEVERKFDEAARSALHLEAVEAAEGEELESVRQAHEALMAEVEKRFRSLDEAQREERSLREEYVPHLQLVKMAARHRASLKEEL